MKRTVALSFAAILVLTALFAAGCGSSNGTELPGRAVTSRRISI